MARTLANDLDVKRKDLLSVFPDALIVDPACRGREFPPTAESVKELAADIVKRGQLQPVSVTVDHEKKLVLVAGFTRFEALLLINANLEAFGLSQAMRILCMVIDGNAEEMFIANISENRLRNETSAIDDAFNMRRLSRDFGKTDEEILTIYGGKSQSWLDQHRKLLTLDRSQQKAIHVGQLSASTGFLLADIAPEARQAIVEQSKDANGKVTTSAVLKEARKQGTLTKQTGLKMVEVKSAFEYLTNDKNVKLAKLAKAYLDYTAGKLPEPDFYGLLRKLVS